MSTADWLGLIISAVGAVGLLAAGRKAWWGWAIGAASEIPWAVFALIVHTPTLLIACVLYEYVYIVNLVKWWRERGA